MIDINGSSSSNKRRSSFGSFSRWPSPEVSEIKLIWILAKVEWEQSLQLDIDQRFEACFAVVVGTGGGSCLAWHFLG